jgi:hypothetical protein
MLFAALLVVERDLRSRHLRLALVAIAATLLISLFYTFPVEALTNGKVAEGGGDLVLRLRFLRFNDWGRLTYLIIPAGIVPALLMIRWRDADVQGRVLTLVSLAYFAFFYMLAFISLHHFAPAMLLPLAVLWRYEATQETGSSNRLRLAVLAGVVVAVAAALPRSLTPFRATRELAQQIAFDPGRVTGAQLFSNTFDASRALDSLFSPYFMVADPQAERVGDPLSLAWYATLANPSRESARYLVQAQSAEAPAGTTRIGTARGFVLYTRDVTAWRQQRGQPPPPDVRSRLYDVSRTTLFQHLGRRAGVYQVDVKELACRVLPRASVCAPSPDPRATS